MLKANQNLSQKQTQQQRLSPQQIQYIKLLQLPTIALEERIREEIELNPVLEEARPDENVDAEEEWDQDGEEEEIDWEEFERNTEYDGNDYGGSYSGSNGDHWRDLPNPYHETLLEKLEQQVQLLNLDEKEKLIADQIIGSLDGDGYFRRETEAVVDNIAFNEGVTVSKEKVEAVRKRIQRLEPQGIASKNLRDCLLVQLEEKSSRVEGRDIALQIVKDYWPSFEKKHFGKLKNKLDIKNELLKAGFDCIKGLDPRPGGTGIAIDDTKNYIEPDFEVRYQEYTDEEGRGRGEGDFVITLNNQNVPPLTISPHYKKMWDELKNAGKSDEKKQKTKSFIKDKVESAQWFINSIRQRQNTLMETMKTIVALQEDFFKNGEGLKPMILKDVAERVGLDISTISRVVNGKYVQTNFGIFELKYFFSEGIATESGEEVSSREVKKTVQEIVEKEDKENPLSDKYIAEKLQDYGYKVARRTVSKYREKLNIPVARLRKQIV